MAQTNLPIACTLGPTDGRDRVQRWRALHDLAHPVARRDGHRLELGYDDRPGVLAELRELAALESQCCGFASWSVSEQAGVSVLTVTVPSDTPDALDAIVALLDTSPA